MRDLRLCLLALVVLVGTAATRASASPWVTDVQVTFGDDFIDNQGKFVGPYTWTLSPTPTGAGSTLAGTCIDPGGSITTLPYETRILHASDSVFGGSGLGNPWGFTTAELQQAWYLNDKFATSATTQYAAIHDALWSITSPTFTVLDDPAGYAAQVAALRADAQSNFNSSADLLVALPVNSTGAFDPAFQPFITATPEPASALLLLVGAAGLIRRKRRPRAGLPITA